jgi:hypothetical protein
VEYYAPLAVLIGFVLYPLTYFGFVVLLHQFVHLPSWAKVMYFFSLPISGVIAFSIHKYYRHVALKWRYLLLMMNRKDTVNELREKKQELRRLLGL